MAGASAFSPRGIPRPVVRELRKTVPISRACTQSLIETCPFARPMGRDFYTLDDFDLSGSTVLLRVDINSPIDPSTGRLLNDRRIREHLATIRDLRHTRVAVLAHQSRPWRDDFTTLEAHADRMGALLGHPVRYVDSLFGLAEVLPSLAGRVVEREVAMVSRAMESQERPKVAIFGGIKADDSIAVTRHMLANGIVDKVLTAGGVATLFLLAKGIDMGYPTKEILEREMSDLDLHVQRCKDLLAKYPGRIEMPIDLAVNDNGTRKNVHIGEFPSKFPVYDIGLDTIVHYQNEVDLARIIIMNGPAGVFELEEFSLGTREIFTAVANSAAFTVVGGGHTVAVVEQLGLEKKIDHLSTGGGALINYLAGKELPLITALTRSREKFPRPSRTGQG